MAVLSESSRSFRAVVGRNSSLLACVLFVLSVLLGAALDRSGRSAVYLLSFWHYYLYWLASLWRGCVRRLQARCRRHEDRLGRRPGDGLSRRTARPRLPDRRCLGILLNVRAAAALGIDRTYYGHEVAGLPRGELPPFPYSLTAHR